MIFAEERSSTTQFELGELFRKASDDSRDYQQAARWYMLSARQGYFMAQYVLGLMYSRGMGVKKDLIQAYAWLKVAASQGYGKASVCLHKCSHCMQEQQLLEARALSRIYYRQYVAPYSY